MIKSIYKVKSNVLVIWLLWLQTNLFILKTKKFAYGITIRYAAV